MAEHFINSADLHYLDGIGRGDAFGALGNEDPAETQLRGLGDPLLRVGVEVFDGAGEYTYVWNGDTAQNSSLLAVDVSGTYTVQVIDANGCMETCTVEMDLENSDDPCFGLRTETQAAWAASPLLASSFGQAFPAGLTIGCGFRKLTLTTNEAVALFLPSQGPSLRLPFGTLVDPGTSYLNSLAGELVALKLAVRFDELDSDFSGANFLLRNAVITSGQFQGFTVHELIEEADSKIGGCFSVYSRNQLRIAIQSINNGYSGGTMASGYLECQEFSVNPDPELEPVVRLPHPGRIPELVSIAYPNPFFDRTTILVQDTEVPERFVIEILTPDGVVLEKIFEGEVMPGVETRYDWNAASRASGLYFYRIRSSEHSFTGRLILQ